MVMNSGFFLIRGLFFLIVFVMIYKKIISGFLEVIRFKYEKKIDINVVKCILVLFLV